jgi:CRISPR-associated endonuclease/helicase Cas3
MSLEPDQFADFYTAVNGYPPFPWQKRLVEQVVAHCGRWPAVLDLPTSAGKTSALDAVVFLLALQVTKERGQFKPIPVHKRAAAIRTFFVVDRRIVVDEAGEKARKLACLLRQVLKPHTARDKQGGLPRPLRVSHLDKLCDREFETLREVASRLMAFGGEKPLHVSVLRGGMYRDGSWAESPTQPTICLSTVDQVGSRLLFRGYGVGPNQRAVHAGLVGNDALILVDEAHLSRPFIETLKAVEFYRSDLWAEKDHHVKTPFQVVVMSATAGESAEPIGAMADEEAKRPPKLGLTLEDRENETLKARLGAAKRARLEEVRGGAEDEEANCQAFAERLAEFARELAATPVPVRTKKDESPAPVVSEANVIGVVVNRVDTARRVQQLLATDPAISVILLTGRIRPYDRDRLLDEWFRYMEAKKDRPTPPCGKLFVVATQTVEVGANLSFDALVTEAAPLDALRQRFGRLDRLGLRKNSNAIIIARKDLLREDDRVYGDRVKATWDWMTNNTTGIGKNKRIDFGIDALVARLPADLSPLSAPSNHAPVLMPAHVDDLVQTTISPVPDPSSELFLHGLGDRPADVSVVWRADLSKELLTESRLARRVVALVPPVSMEALPLPVWHLQKWLRNRMNAGPANFTDVEGERSPEPKRLRGESESDPFLIWKGPDYDDDTVVSSDPEDINPGDTIVVPSTYGGCDRFGWNPEFHGEVTDVADDCSWRAKRRPVLRVHPESKVHTVALAAWTRLSDPLPVEILDALPERLAVDPETGERNWAEVSEAFGKPVGKYGWLRNPRRVEYPSRKDSNIPGVLFVAKPREGGWDHPDDRATEDDTTDAPADDDGNSFLGADGLITLANHCRGVQRWVERFADRLGLTAFRDVLSRAAVLHDAGKADPRFQEWLFGNSVDAAKNSDNPIAKSGTDSRNAAAVEAARRRAGWPKHARHEALSVLLVRDHEQAKQGVPDPGLLVHLIGTHHGRGRPLWPVTLDDAIPSGAEVPDRITCQLNGYEMNTTGRQRPETELTPFHAGWVDDFWRMVTKYGYWGLAYLEMLLVLADHRQSEAEKEAGG